MKTDTSKKILDFIEFNQQASPKEIIDFLGFSQVAVQKQLKKLIEDSLINKIGQPPRVFYKLINPVITKANLGNKEQFTVREYGKKYAVNPKPFVNSTGLLAQLDFNTLENDYIYISPTGKMLYGLEGFEEYCIKNQLPLFKTLKEYLEIKAKYDKLKLKNGLIDATSKLTNSFENQAINKLFYLDFYSYERFGKTALAQLTFQAKQSQDKHLISKIATLIKPTIVALINQEKIAAVAFVPPTVDRKIQFQKELARQLNLSLPQIEIIKSFDKNHTPVQQKTLKKLQDRIENARETFFVIDHRRYKNVLLIDDFVGSGASLNQLGVKLKQKHTCEKKLIALGLTGSLKGFEVVNQV